MKKIVAALACALALCVGAVPSFAASPAPAASANADMLGRAKAWFASLQTGKVDRTQMTDEMNKDLSDDQLKTLAAKIGPLGDPTAFEQVQVGSQAGSSVYTYRLAFSNGDHLNFQVAIDGSDKISGFYVLPPQ